MMSKFKFISSDVLYVSFKTYCMPLFGSVLWDLTDVNMNRFYVAWHKAIRRVWKISPQTHCVLLPVTCNDLPIEVQMCKAIFEVSDITIKQL